MFGSKRPFWKSLLLHAVLIAGSVVFALPFAWLVGTSWKLDKELQTAEVRIIPQKPIPTPVSPYIDGRAFEEVEKPDAATALAWEAWMEEAVKSQLDDATATWQDPRTEGLDKDVLTQELREGLFRRLLSLAPKDVWKIDEPEAFEAAIANKLTASTVADVFDQAYRCFTIGTIRLVTQDYRVFTLLDGSAPAPWQSDSKSLELLPRQEAGRNVTVCRYDLRADPFFATEIHLTAPIDLHDPNTGFKTLEISFRSDQTWHEFRVRVDIGGMVYQTEEPKYLGDDQWQEVLCQLPGPDDDRLMPRRYIRLAQTGEIDHYSGPDEMTVQLVVGRSSRPEAWWAKCTENYRRAFDEVPFWRYFKTSVFLVAVNIIGTLLSCSLVAYAFARLNWPGRDLCFVLVLATLMIPPQVTMIPSFVIYKYLGWYNTLAPLWVPNALALNGFAIFLLRQAMKGIPKDLEEAAKIDGCSHLRIYWDVILPLVKPTLAAIAIFTFMFVWNDFMAPLIYVNDQRLYPLSLGLFSFPAGRENQFTLIMAGSMIMTLPVIITFFLAQRYFIQGVTMSGMKS